MKKGTATMEISKNQSIDSIAKIFLKTTQNTLRQSTGKEISYANTIQKITRISMRPDLTCFVQFSGDYMGLVIFNFSDEAAFEIYSQYMINMGMPEDELATSISDPEVADTIGEITNQLMGQLIKSVEEEYDLNADYGQPKALTIGPAISLSINDTYTENRRLSFKISNYIFRIEIAMEDSEFIDVGTL
jgi:CheY-specific phosphatase CheX